jgi:hypothetical protein
MSLVDDTAARARETASGPARADERMTTGPSRLNEGAAAEALIGPRVYTPFATRESWLTAGIEQLRGDFERVGAPLPSGVRVSVGFPRGRRTAIGQCFSTKASTDGTNHVFISPVLEHPVDTLAVLCHELVHVADDCRSGHRGDFARIARALGLVGPMRATQPSEGLVARFSAMADELGPYPHRALAPRVVVGAQRDSSTRMLKVVCPTCGYLLRTTRFWLESKGTPVCPDGTRLVRAGR